MSSQFIQLPQGAGGGSGGTVTSVALTAPSTVLTVSGSPVTTSGTLALALASASGNVFLASPANGSSGALALRVIAGADLPNPSSTTLGGIRSAAAVVNKIISSISTSGVPALTTQNQQKTATWDNRAGGVALTTGTSIWWSAPFAGTIVGWVLLADQSTTSTINVKKNTYANWPTENDITGGNLPGLTAALKNQDTTLTSWTLAVAAGDILEFSIASNNNAQFLQLFLNLVGA